MDDNPSADAVANGDGDARAAVGAAEAAVNNNIDGNAAANGDGNAWVAVDIARAAVDAAEAAVDNNIDGNAPANGDGNARAAVDIARAAVDAARVAADNEDDEDEFITVGFNRTLMEMRVNALQQFLSYRRNSFQFPHNLETQFLIFLKLYRYEFQRHLFPLDTPKYILDHLAGIIMFERILTKYTNFIPPCTPFAISEGWLIGPIKCECDKCSTLNSYLYKDPQLNFLHHNLK